MSTEMCLMEFYEQCEEDGMNPEEIELQLQKMCEEADWQAECYLETLYDDLEE